MITSVPKEVNYQFGMIDWDFLVILSVALIAFIVRLSRRQTRSGDWVAMGVLFGSTAVVAVQSLLIHRIFASCWRMLYPGYAVAVVYCGWLVSSLCRRHRFAGMALGVAALVALAVPAGVRLSRYMHGRNHFWCAVRHAENESARLIRADWKGPADSENPDLATEFYQTRLPIVYSATGRCAYLSKGRQFDIYAVAKRKEGYPHYWLLIDDDGEDFADSIYGRESRAVRKPMKVFRGDWGRATLYKTEQP